MRLLKTMGTGQGWLKAGFLGFPKSGKTYTATLLAIAVRELFKNDGAIAIYDTETGAEYIAPMIKKLTGNMPIGVRSRSFEDLLASAQEAEKAGCSIFLADSVTHPWRELCDAYLVKVNAARKKKRLPARNRLEFQDWNPIKATWAKWTNWYLNSPVHVIISGRAGFEYEWRVDEETERKELLKTGVKMKTETEFGFEPSLLVEMERIQKRNETTQMIHRATVIGDRFGVIDGKMQDFISQGDPKKGMKTEADLKKEMQAVFNFFRPHLDGLQPGKHAPVDTDVKTHIDVDEEGHDQIYRMRREKEIYLEEIKEQLLRAYPKQNNEHKVAKADLLETVFNTRSWTRVSSFIPTDILKEGLAEIRRIVAKELGEETQGAEGKADEKSDDIPF